MKFSLNMNIFQWVYLVDVNKSSFLYDDDKNDNSKISGQINREKNIIWSNV